MLRLYSAIHIGSCWKIQDRRQIGNTDNMETKHNPEKANNAKHSKTKLSWFSRLLRHSARKWGGFILQCSRAQLYYQQNLISVMSSAQKFLYSSVFNAYVWLTNQNFIMASSSTTTTMMELYGSERILTISSAVSMNGKRMNKMLLE